jgi:hypothetical protein
MRKSTEDPKIKESIKRITENSGDVKFIFFYDRRSAKSMLKRLSNNRMYRDRYPEMTNDVNDKASRLAVARIYWYDDIDVTSHGFGDSVGIADCLFTIGDFINLRVLDRSNAIYEFGEHYYTTSRINIIVDEYISMNKYSRQEYSTQGYNKEIDFLNNIQKIESIEISIEGCDARYNFVMLDGSKTTVKDSILIDWVTK